MQKTQETLKKMETVVKAVDDKKGINIKVLDVSQESGYTDYMIFATGTSTQHNNAMNDNVVKNLKSAGFGRPIVEGNSNSQWILVDSGDVIVNIMTEDMRQYYDLESIWKKSKSIDINQIIK